MIVAFNILHVCSRARGKNYLFENQNILAKRSESEQLPTFLFEETWTDRLSVRRQSCTILCIILNLFLATLSHHLATVIKVAEKKQMHYRWEDYRHRSRLGPHLRFQSRSVSAGAAAGSCELISSPTKSKETPFKAFLALPAIIIITEAANGPGVEGVLQGRGGQWGCKGNTRFLAREVLMWRNFKCFTRREAFDSLTRFPHPAWRQLYIAVMETFNPMSVCDLWLLDCHINIIIQSYSNVQLLTSFKLYFL